MTKAGITSFIIALLGIINILASNFGFSPLDISESDITAVVTVAFAIGGLVSTAWHNFNITEAAKTGQKLTDSIKADE